MLADSSWHRFDQGVTRLQAFGVHASLLASESNHMHCCVLLACSDTKMWGAGANNGDGSGLGSSVPYTAKIRAALPALIKKYKINSMLDSSCGSMHWMPLVLREVKAQNKEFRFMGTDVVCSLIDRHLKTFKKETDWKFQVGIHSVWFGHPRGSCFHQVNSNCVQLSGASLQCWASARAVLHCGHDAQRQQVRIEHMPGMAC